MIASELKLIPFPILQFMEELFLPVLDTLPVTYRKDLLRDPQYRYPYLYYLLVMHRPRLLEGAIREVTAEDLFYTGYYWLHHLTKQYEARHGFDEGLEQQAAQMLETSAGKFDPEIVHQIQERVTAEIATNEK